MMNFNKLKRAIWAAALSLCAMVHGFSQSPDVRISNVAYISGLTGAMQLTHADDGSNRVFIAERAGIIKVFLPAAPATAINLINLNATETQVSQTGEGGLLSIAFHPSFETNGYFYTYYTNPAGNLVVSRYTATGNTASVSSRKQIIEIPHPTNANHNGGKLHFGPTDGYLYLSTGDGGGGNDVPNNAQNPASLLGKILRIDVNTADNVPYAVPPTNPDPGSLVYASGLRNPFRWNFDRLTNAMWIGDVGQGAREEINYVPAGDIAGANFGWRCFEGDIETPGVSRTGCGPAGSYRAPVYTYPTGDERGRSVIGGVVYRGTAFPLMYGYYIGTDYTSGQIHKVSDIGVPDDYQTSTRTGVVDIGETENGEIYAVTGTAVYSIFASNPLPVKLVSFSGVPGNEGVNLSWKTSEEVNASRFEIEYGVNAAQFEKVGEVSAMNASTGTAYSFSHNTTLKSNLYYRLKMVDIDDTFEYSRIIYVDNSLGEVAHNFIRPTLITNKTLNLVLPRSFQSVELIGTGGHVFMKQEISGRSGEFSLPLKAANSGLYVVRLSDHDKVVQQKVLVVE